MKNSLLFGLIFLMWTNSACRAPKTSSDSPVIAASPTPSTSTPPTKSTAPSKSTSPANTPLTADYIGTWHDRSGLDGCAWMIELKDAKIQSQEWVIPINTADFKLQPKEGQMIQFNCEVISQMNICMAGTTIKFTAIK